MELMDMFEYLQTVHIFRGREVGFPREQIINFELDAYESYIERYGDNDETVKKFVNHLAALILTDFRLSIGTKYEVEEIYNSTL